MVEKEVGVNRLIYRFTWLAVKPMHVCVCACVCVCLCVLVCVVTCPAVNAADTSGANGELKQFCAVVCVS